jgi:hypothetical protein
MEIKSPSVLRCIEKATQCGQRAAIAITEADMLRELEMAVTWLEIAKSRASCGDPLAWAESTTKGKNQTEH